MLHTLAHTPTHLRTRAHAPTPADTGTHALTAWVAAVFDEKSYSVYVNRLLAQSGPKNETATQSKAMVRPHKRPPPFPFQLPLPTSPPPFPQIDTQSETIPRIPALTNAGINFIPALVARQPYTGVLIPALVYRRSNTGV